MISTRGRYALRVLLDLAENQNEGYIAMKTVAHRQELSLKYIYRELCRVLLRTIMWKGYRGKAADTVWQGNQKIIGLEIY